MRIVYSQWLASPHNYDASGTPGLLHSTGFRPQKLLCTLLARQLQCILYAARYTLHVLPLLYSAVMMMHLAHCSRGTLWVTLSHTLKVHLYLPYLPLYITQSCKTLHSLDSKRRASSHFWLNILPQNALVIGL